MSVALGSEKRSCALGHARHRGFELSDDCPRDKPACLSPHPFLSSHVAGRRRLISGVACLAYRASRKASVHERSLIGTTNRVPEPRAIPVQSSPAGQASQTRNLNRTRAMTRPGAGIGRPQQKSRRLLGTERHELGGYSKSVLSSLVLPPVESNPRNAPQDGSSVTTTAPSARWCKSRYAALRALPARAPGDARKAGEGRKRRATAKQAHHQDKVKQAGEMSRE